MKQIFRIITILASMLCATTLSSFAENRGLLAHFTFDNDAKNKLPGSLYQIIPENIVYSSTAKINGGAQFNGSTSSIRIEKANATINLNALTISTWIRLSRGNNTRRMICVLQDRSNYKWGSFIEIDKSNRVRFSVQNKKTGSRSQVSSKIRVIPSSQFVHIAGTWTKGSGKVQDIHLFINGIDETNSSSFNPAGRPSSLKINSTTWAIGYDPRGYGSRFNGIIDDLRIYNRALSGSEIQNLYKAASDTTISRTTDIVSIENKFKSYWPMSGASSTSFWKERIEFNKEQYNTAKQMAFAGKAITVSKDLVDVYATLATGVGIFEAPGLATKFYKIGKTLYGSNTPEALKTADKAIGYVSVIKGGYKGRKELLSVIHVGRKAVRSEFGSKAVSFAQDTDTYREVSTKASALESLGINILGVAIDELVVNKIADTVEYQLFEMKDHLMLWYLGKHIYPLWIKFTHNEATKKDIETIIEAELFYFEAWLKELTRREAFWKNKKNLHEVRKIKSIRRDVIEGLNKRLKSRKKIYGY